MRLNEVVVFRFQAGEFSSDVFNDLSRSMRSAGVNESVDPEPANRNRGSHLILMR